jgi:hypothetical protein
MRSSLRLAALLIVPAAWLGAAAAQDKQPDRPWRALPLVADGKVDRSWAQIGWGGFAVEGDSLRTDCDEKGMGLLLYKKEKFGDCQLRVVYQCKDAKSNSGVFVRIDDGVLGRIDEKAPAMRRDKDGKLSEEMLQKLKDAADKELGPWYPVHHGYEVQISDAADEYHRTGAVYSLAKAAPLPETPADGWRTMVITLRGNWVLVDVDGKRISEFDPDGKNVPPAKNWTEPRREPKRPRSGYIGLQNHDPGDVVYFKEVSVRPLGAAP